MESHPVSTAPEEKEPRYSVTVKKNGSTLFPEDSDGLERLIAEAMGCFRNSMSGTPTQALTKPGSDLPYRRFHFTDGSVITTIHLATDKRTGKLAGVLLMHGEEPEWEPESESEREARAEVGRRAIEFQFIPEMSELQQEMDRQQEQLLESLINQDETRATVMDFENAIDICSCSVRTSDTESASIIKALISACDPDRSHRCVTFEEEAQSYLDNGFHTLGSYNVNIPNQEEASKMLLLLRSATWAGSARAPEAETTTADE